MAITKEDLQAYKAEKEKELTAVSQEEAAAKADVKEKVAEYEQTLNAAVDKVIDQKRSAINAEIKLLDELLVKEAKQEELL